jgi:restriction system protein
MARRRKSSFLEDLIGISAALPWWAGVLLALTSYLFLHNIATAPQVNAANLVPGQLGSFAAGELKRTLALFGQYILPFVFSLGAFLSFIRNKKDKNEESVYSSYSKQSTNENSPSCPNCGSSMVKRQAKKGVNAGGYFWGCSSFPNCYGKRNY